MKGILKDIDNAGIKMPEKIQECFKKGHKVSCNDEVFDRSWTCSECNYFIPLGWSKMVAEIYDSKESGEFTGD